MKCIDCGYVLLSDGVCGYMSCPSNFLIRDSSDYEPPVCEKCGEDGIHVCLPEVVKLLKKDKKFKKMIAKLVKEELEEQEIEEINRAFKRGGPLG